MPETVIIRNKFDIINYVNDHPRSTRRIKMLVFIALASIFGDAYDFSALGVGIHSLTAQLNLNSVEVGLATSIMAAGALASTLLGGFIADRTGRYKLFIICSVLLVVAPIGQALSVNFAMLAFFRLLLGIAVGLDMPVAFSFMAELLNSGSKGKWINLWQPVSSAACILGVLAALPFYFGGAGDSLWRWVVGIGALPALISLVLRLIYAEESPMWAAEHQGLRQAGKVLSSTYGVTVDVQDDGTGDKQEVTKYPLSVIFTQRFRLRTFLVSVMMGAQSLEYYAIGFYLPVIASLVFGADLTASIITTALAQFCGLLTGLLQSSLTQRVGIRRLAIIGYIVTFACLVGLGLLGDSGWTENPAIPIALVMAFMAGHTFGPGAQGKTMATLSYPTEIRGIGTGWGETMGRVASMLGLFLFPVLLEHAGQSLTMYVLALAPLAAIVSLRLIKWDPTRHNVDVEDSLTGHNTGAAPKEAVSVN